MKTLSCDYMKLSLDLDFFFFFKFKSLNYSLRNGLWFTFKISSFLQAEWLYSIWNIASQFLSSSIRLKLVAHLLCV